MIRWRGSAVFPYVRTSTLQRRQDLYREALEVIRLRHADPDLSTLQNLNHPADYLAALKTAGFQPKPAILAALDRPHNA